LPVPSPETTTVSDLRSQISKGLNNLGVGKFQLVRAGVFLKPSDMLGTLTDQVELKWRLK